MKKLHVSLENCYGITTLEACLDFTKCNVVAIYASNGVMKTSFLKTMANIDEPKEEIYGRKAVCVLKDENNTKVSQENIFVIGSLNEDFVPEHETELLVNKELHQKYDEIYDEIAKHESIFLNRIKLQAGIKTRGINCIKQQMLEDFKYKDSFMSFIKSLKSEVEFFSQHHLSELVYANIFNNDTKRIFDQNNFQDALSTYVDTYNDLLQQSDFFKRGFNHYNADIIAKALDVDGWFDAGHFVKLKSKESLIGSKDVLYEFIKKEKERIISNEDLLRSFHMVDNLLKTKGTREFREYLSEHKEILVELQDHNAFKQKLWKSYIAKHKAEYMAFLYVVEHNLEKLQFITDAALNQVDDWKKVVEIFNTRFFVPFKVEISNKTDVILGLQTPHRQLFFDDGKEVIEVDEDRLRRVLSQGERRAKYLMDIIFELESFKRTGAHKLLIFDDIADSFDYKNKYAIIEYLYDIAKYDTNFNLIILTHNFDFYRSVTSRLGVSRSNRLIANKTQDGIVLSGEEYQKRHPFEIWKKCQDVRDAIALIPFVRNIVEFCKNEEDEDYLTLTSLLHKKANMPSISMKELQIILNKYIQIPADGGGIFFADKQVETRIYELAANILGNNESNDLRDKIILSMAARLRLETYMIGEINDSAFVSSIRGNQTHKLSEKYRELYPENAEVNAIITEVNLITPENIHINSFMYEPIIDISTEHLKAVYSKILSLVKS